MSSVPLPGQKVQHGFTLFGASFGNRVTLSTPEGARGAKFGAREEFNMVASVSRVQSKRTSANSKREKPAKLEKQAASGAARSAPRTAKPKAKAKAGAAKLSSTRKAVSKAQSSKAPSSKTAKAKVSNSQKPTAAKKPSKKSNGHSGRALSATQTQADVKDRPAIREGDSAPSFLLQDQDERLLSSEDLLGAPYVLYFYPKDDTPGCTKEACGFRDQLSAFNRSKVKVLGVSPDSTRSHQRFREKYKLTFPLLSDPEKNLARAYGVWVKKQNYGRDYMGIERSTFLVDADGVVRKIWRKVRVPGHVEQVLREAKESRS